MTLGLSDAKKCRGCNEERETEKAQAGPSPSCGETRNQIPEELVKWEQRTRTSKEGSKWQRGIMPPLE